MCDLNTDWIADMIVRNDLRMERIEGTLERIEKLIEKLVEGKRVDIEFVPWPQKRADLETL